MKLLFMFVILVSSFAVNAVCSKGSEEKTQTTVLARDMTKVECKIIPNLKAEDRYTISSCNAYKRCISADNDVDSFTPRDLDKEKLINKQIATRHAEKKIKNEISDRLKYELLKLQVEKNFPEDSTELNASIRNTLNVCEEKYKVKANSDCNPELLVNSKLEDAVKKLKKIEEENSSLIQISSNILTFKTYLKFATRLSDQDVINGFILNFGNNASCPNLENPLLLIFGTCDKKNKFRFNRNFLSLSEKISSAVNKEQRIALWDKFIINQVDDLAVKTCDPDSTPPMQTICNEATVIANGGHSDEQLCSNNELNIFLNDQGLFDLDVSYQTCQSYGIYETKLKKYKCEMILGLVEFPVDSGNYVLTKPTDNFDFPIDDNISLSQQIAYGEVFNVLGADHLITPKEESTLATPPTSDSEIVQKPETVSVLPVDKANEGHPAVKSIDTGSTVEYVAPDTISPVQQSSAIDSYNGVGARSAPTPITYSPMVNTATDLRGANGSEQVGQNAEVQTLNDNLDKLTKKVEATQTQLVDQTHQAEIAALNQKIADLQAAPVSKASAPAVPSVLATPVMSVAPSASKEDAVVPVEAKEATPTSTASAQHASNEKATPAIAPSATADTSKTATVSTSNGSGVLNLEIHDVPNVDLLHQDHQVPNDSILELARNSKEEHFAITDKNKIVWIVTPLYEKGVIVDYIAITQSDYDKKSKEKLAHTIKKPSSRAPASVTAKKHSLLSDLNKLLDGKKK